jgi:hypothetical protein
MRTFDSLSNDDSGASVLVEYVFIIVIMATFFTMFLLLVNSTIRNTDEVIVGQELGIVANDIANRISEFSNKVSIFTYNSTHWTSNVSGYSEAIDLPELAQGKQYSIKIKYNDNSGTGNITVYYGSNYNINRTVSFQSGTKVAETTISSTDANPQIYFVSNTIRVEGL